MWGRLKGSIINDIKIISHDTKLIILSLTPLFLIVILKLFFPLLSNLISSGAGLNINGYYSFTAITFISVIPLLIGTICSFVLQNDNDNYFKQDTQAGSSEKSRFLILRMTGAALLCFVFVIITILIEEPVPEQGWLRTLFVAFLLSVQAPFIFLFISAFSENRIIGSRQCWLCLVFLIAVPCGLVLHHPFNYFAFFSPLYWIAWVWIIPSPVESIIYGSIAVLLTTVVILLLIRKFMRKYAG